MCSHEVNSVLESSQSEGLLMWQFNIHIKYLGIFLIYIISQCAMKAGTLMVSNSKIWIQHHCLIYLLNVGVTLLSNQEGAERGGEWLQAEAFLEPWCFLSIFPPLHVDSWCTKQLHSGDWDTAEEEEESRRARCGCDWGAVHFQVCFSWHFLSGESVSVWIELPVSTCNLYMWGKSVAVTQRCTWVIFSRKSFCITGYSHLYSNPGEKVS
jgi:hypothetical protein